MSSMSIYEYHFVAVVHLLSHVRLFANAWTAPLQAPQSFTISQSSCIGDAI